MKRSRSLGGLRGVLLATCLTLVSSGFYLIRAQATFGLGLPLDDAWIHQTYARNLVERGEWAFQSGDPSAGSTSPLWSGILAFGRLLGIHPLAWAYVVGGALLLSIAVLVSLWVQRRIPEHSRWAILLGPLTLVEWHLVWASLSGMEILAFAAVALSVLLIAEREGGSPWWLGSLIGIGVWLRPEAILLLLPVLWTEGWRRAGGWSGVARRNAPLLVALLIPVLLYGLFNRALSGTGLPTTWYAKSAEYAVLRGIPLAVRLAAQLGIPGQMLGYPELASGGPLVGALLLLAPAGWIAVWGRFRRDGASGLAPLVWVLAHLTAYALRLPPTYQHGRYAMPVIPVLLALGGEGLLTWCRPQASEFRRRVVSRAWLLSTALVALYFWAAGAGAYATDVAIIQSEMVATAGWVQRNTEPQALVAAHDIGALGYFSGRELVDLAGLVSPEVVGFLRNEEALADYLDDRQADYLVSFPSWYPNLTSNLEAVFVSSGIFSPAAGGENMAVYRWSTPRFAP